jgi:predicted esterase
MTKKYHLTLTVFLVLLLSACAKAAQKNAEGMINPGDEINGMVFTTTDEIDWDLSLAFFCDFESIEETDASPTIACFTSPGSSVFFGNFSGIPYDNIIEAEKPWKEIKSEVTFDGQNLNLPAFGYMEIELNEAEWKYARIWNLMVDNISPGKHTIQTVWKDGDETQINTYVFTVAEKPEIFPTLSTEVVSGLQFYTSEKANINYILYIPSNYGENSAQKWPVLIYLHGMDRVNTSVEVLKNDYPLNALADEDYFPFIVVAPQGIGEYEFWATDEMVNSIMALLDEIETMLSLDTNRIYLTGGSAGGNGTWSIGVRHPERFAALVSFMGYYGWPPSVPENICDLVDVPVQAFHGANDELIPLDAEQKLVDALIACGGNVQFTVFPDAGHDIEAERVYTPELYSWLLEQTLK